MGKRRGYSGPMRVQGLSVDALRVEPVAEGLQPKPLSGDQLHQLAQAQVARGVDAVLQRAGLAPREPKPLTLSEAVQRAAVFNQIKRGLRR
jgi:hypothetical protein